MGTLLIRTTGKLRIGDVSSGRDNNFNLLRLFAAVGVLVSHAYPISYGPEAVEPLTLALKGITLGSLSVMIFFAISGFFITRSFEQRSSLRSFVRARFLRIFPALAVVLSLTVLVVSFISTVTAPTFWTAVPEYFLRNLTLFFLEYELPGVFENNPFGASTNGSLWTLSYEVLCYFGVVVFGLLGVFKKARVFALSIFIFGLSYWLCFAFGIQGRVETLMSLALPFVCGAAFWVWRDRIPLSVNLALVGGVLAVLMWPTALFIPVFTIAVSYLVFVLGYMPVPWVRRSSGDYSYGTYVYSFPIQQLVVFFGVTSPLLNIAWALPLTLICAALSWHLIERPSMRWKRKEASTPASMPDVFSKTV